jgi:alpha-tubulin suppressor-like RCC1 family protein
VRSDGTLWCWGYNGDGELGLASAVANSLSPAQVTSPSSTGCVSVVTGAYSTCAVRSDSTLYCWGANGSGQLGLNDQTNRNAPVQVTSPSSTGWVQSALGYGHSCAIRTGAKLYCWGNGANGRLGNGATTSSNLPVQVPGTTWAAASAGSDHTCAIKSTNTLWCWGYGGNGRLGQGSTADAQSPAQVGSAIT